MNHAASKELSISALVCHKCGAPMCPDMKKGGFSCLYCDTFRPFAVTDEDFAPAVKFRHQPVKIVEGLLKLGHVAIEVKEALIPPPREERLKRLLPIDRKLLERDAEAFNAFRDESVCLDWAWPRSIIYDIFLMDELAPWDYGELTALKPAYLEGKVQLLASENLGDWQAKIPDWILQRTAPQRLRRAFGLEKIQLRWVSRDIRNHSYGLVLLPIYAMEISLENGGFLRLMMIRVLREYAFQSTLPERGRREAGKNATK